MTNYQTSKIVSSKISDLNAPGIGTSGLLCCSYVTRFPRYQSWLGVDPAVDQLLWLIYHTLYISA